VLWRKETQLQETPQVSVVARAKGRRRVKVNAAGNVALLAEDQLFLNTPMYANTPGEAIVIAMHAHLEPRPHWAPPGQHPVQAGDRLIVVATRAGLADVVDRAAVRSAAAA